MPRANRYFVAGQIYHLTHRCHDRQFHLKFARDRNAYRMKLWQALGQFDVSLLDYCLTSNHVHLLTRAEDTEQISCFMQKVAGEFAQGYNRRKHRSGAFWEDRFHSTMIQPDGHLHRCMVYLALNMVRCGAVEHPRQWPWCGYQELMGLRQRFRLLDFEHVLELMGGISASEFRLNHEAAIYKRIARKELQREPKWTESIAVGVEDYVRERAAQIRGRQQLEIEGSDGTWTLKDAATPYIAFSETDTRCKLAPKP
jgi:putative transposase